MNLLRVAISFYFMKCSSLFSVQLRSFQYYLYESIFIKLTVWLGQPIFQIKLNMLYHSVLLIYANHINFADEFNCGWFIRIIIICDYS